MERFLESNTDCSQKGISGVAVNSQSLVKIWQTIVLFPQYVWVLQFLYGHTLISIVFSINCLESGCIKTFGRHKYLLRNKIILILHIINFIQSMPSRNVSSGTVLGSPFRRRETKNQVTFQQQHSSMDKPGQSLLWATQEIVFCYKF